MPALRDQLAEWLATYGRSVLNSYARHAGHEDIALLYEPICKTALQANLYCVAPDMLELALQAATPSLEDLDISEHDLPANMGLVSFAQPIRVDRNYGQTTPISGALWFRWQSSNLDIVTVCWLTDRYSPDFVWFLGADGTPANPTFGHGCRRVTAEDWYNAEDFRLAIHGMDNLPVGELDPSATITDEGSLVGGMRSDRAVLKAIWLLMSQSLAEVETVKVGPPPQRRRGPALPRPEVRVIKLRRPAGASGGAADGREWQHRWMVRGHWRMQPWGPNRERVRPVWIAPHLKGPEGKPMLGGEKVYHLAR